MGYEDYERDCSVFDRYREEEDDREDIDTLDYEVDMFEPKSERLRRIEELYRRSKVTSISEGR